MKRTAWCGVKKVEKSWPNIRCAWELSPLWHMGHSEPLSRSENLDVLLHFGSGVRKEESERGAPQVRAENQKITPDLIAEQKPQFPFKLEHFFRGSKESHWTQLAALYAQAPWNASPLYKSWRNTTGHRYLCLFKIDMFLKTWLHNTFCHVELYFFTDFNKRVENTFQ